jgi:hypothetical protein
MISKTGFCSNQPVPAVRRPVKPAWMGLRAAPPGTAPWLESIFVVIVVIDAGRFFQN